MWQHHSLRQVRLRGEIGVKGQAPKLISMRFLDMESKSDPAHIILKIPRRALQLCADKLPSGVTVLMVPPDAFPPEFIRLPDNGERCSVTGMSRTWLIERIRDSRKYGTAIKVHHIRSKGALRGVVLIDRASLVAWLAEHDEPEWVNGKMPSPVRQSRS